MPTDPRHRSAARTPRRAASLLPILLVTILVPRMQPALPGGAEVFAQQVPPPSQDAPPEDDRHEQPQIEQLFEDLADDVDAAPLAEEIESGYARALDLNTCTFEELAAVPGIDPALARRIIDVRAQRGGFRTIDDVAELPWLDETALRMLSAWTRTAPHDESHRGSTGSSGARDARRQQGWNELAALRVRVRAEDALRKGFTDGSFAGSPLGTLLRLRISPLPWLRAGAVTQKDAGESSLADHGAWHVVAEDPERGHRVTAGQFSIAAAQGLVFWKPWGTVHGGDPVAVSRRTASPVSAWMSSAERGYFSGVAGESRLGALTVLGFASNAPLDARIDTSIGMATSIDRSGLHRLESEIRRRSNVRLHTLGGRVSITTGSRLRVGSSAWTARSSMPFAPRSAFVIDERHASMLGVDADLYLDGMHLFAEAARAHTGGLGAVVGLSGRPVTGLGLGMLLRWYDPDFVSLHGNGWRGGGDGGWNEQGARLGVRWSPRRGVTVDAGGEVWRRPERSTTIAVPTQGDAWTFSARWQAASRVTLSGRLRIGGDDVSASTVSAVTGIREAVRRMQRSTRAEIGIRASPRHSFRIRLEQTWVSYLRQGGTGGGGLGFAELRSRPVQGLTLTARATVWETRSYDARVYLYEYEVPGIGGTLALSGSGARLHLAASLALPGQVSLAASYARSMRSGITGIGSGVDLVAGDALGVITMQLDFRM